MRYLAAAIRKKLVHFRNQIFATNKEMEKNGWYLSNLQLSIV